MQITILQAILLGLFCFLVSTGMFPLGWLSMNIMSKPLIHCMIIGLIMGDMKNALIIGCVIQAAYIGQMSIGGVATLPSINVALWFALTIALAFAAVQNILNTVGNLVKVGFLHRQDALIEKGKIKQAWWFPACGHIWTFVSCMIIVPVFCLAGSAVISNIVNALPPQINAITSTFTGLLPAIGFMILMVTLIHTPFQWIYFLFGFVLAAALGWDTISITIMGCVIAYLIFQFTPGKQLAGAAVEEDDD